MADLLAKLPTGFGSMMTSIGLLIIFGGIFGDMLGESGWFYSVYPHLLWRGLHYDCSPGRCWPD